VSRFELEAAVEMANEGLGFEPLMDALKTNDVRFREWGCVGVSTSDGPVDVKRTETGWKVQP